MLNYPFEKASSPEAVGVPSNALSDLLDTIEGQRMTLHGLMVVSQGQVAFEASWPSFDVDALHRMYSVSKSIVALAIGLMVDEGRITLADRVHTFFPDKTTAALHPYLRDATIRDLLMMATPHTDQSYTVDDPDWVQTFFSVKPSHPSGTVFSYDTSGTVVLCTIVERLSGIPFLEYMRPRVLDPIGFSKDAWCIKTPEGSSWGGSGVLCSLRDMAKLAYLCMHHGRWNGRQLISADFIDAAIAKQIDNAMIGGVGYGYQIWRTKGNGFAFNGMGGQHAFAYPDKDLLIACTADRQSDPSRAAISMDDLAYTLMERVFPHEIKISESDKETLVDRVAKLSLPALEGKESSPLIGAINGRWFTFTDGNPMEIRRARLVIDGREGAFEYENQRGKKRIGFGIGYYKEDFFPEHYFDEQIGFIGNRYYRSLNTAIFVEPHKLYLRVCISDIYFGGLQVTISYKENQMAIHMTKVAEWFLANYQGFAGGQAEV